MQGRTQDFYQGEVGIGFKYLTGFKPINLSRRFNALKYNFLKFTKMRFGFIENKIHDNVLRVKSRISI